MLRAHATDRLEDLLHHPVPGLLLTDRPKSELFEHDRLYRKLIQLSLVAHLVKAPLNPLVCLGVFMGWIIFVLLISCWLVSLNRNRDAAQQVFEKSIDRGLPCPRLRVKRNVRDVDNDWNCRSADSLPDDPDVRSRSVEVREEPPQIL